MNILKNDALGECDWHFMLLSRVLCGEGVLHVVACCCTLVYAMKKTSQSLLNLLQTAKKPQESHKTSAKCSGTDLRGLERPN